MPLEAISVPKALLTHKRGKDFFSPFANRYLPPLDPVENIDALFGLCAK